LAFCFRGEVGVQGLGGGSEKGGALSLTLHLAQSELGGKSVSSGHEKGGEVAFETYVGGILVRLKSLNVD
jgi:hypothetical protein